MNLLRHYRAAAHLVAVRATGLTPVEAILTGDDGEAGAVAFGWQPPFPAPGPLMRKRAWAEALTDRIAGETFRGFTTAERQEFVRLVDDAAEHSQSPNGELPQAATPHNRAWQEAESKDPKESRIGSAVRVDP
jgi:hypothetical protein